MIRKCFRQCDICGIGLGKYELEWKDWKGRVKNVKVKGDELRKWEYGPISLRCLDFVKGDLVWVERMVKPKRLCWCCFDRYSEKLQ